MIIWTVFSYTTIDVIEVYKHFDHIFGQGSGDIWIRNAQCTGIENSIFDCVIMPRLGRRKIDMCNHYQDVGISCYHTSTTTGNSNNYY